MKNSAGQLKVLAIEDDPNTLELIGVYLENEGFSAIKAGNGRKGLEMAGRHQPDLVLLDLMLPEMDGWEVCRQLRKTSDVPIIMLTARGDEIDRVSGLTLGADDYVVKPFSPRELMARVRAVLRRAAPPKAGSNPPAKTVISFGSLTLDSEKKQLRRNGAEISLTPHEYALFQKLVSRPGRVFSRDELIDCLYPQGEAVVIDRVVDVHIGKLRQKIEPTPSRPVFILTVRGMGYKFSDQNGASSQ